MTNNAELQHFSDSLYRSPLCADSFSDGMKHRAKDDALTKKYIGLNRTYRAYIVIDIDDCPTAFRWEERHLPPPSIVAINPQNGHCHYYYRLNTPVCFTERGRKHPKDFYNAVKDQLTAALGGDPAYAGAMAKNPFSVAWKVLTFPRSYDLADFSEWFVNINAAAVRPKLLDGLWGRNTALFTELSKFAHTEYKNVGSADELLAIVKLQADALNKTLEKPLSYAEVKATARSVGRGVWKWRKEHPSRALSAETLAMLQAHATALKTAGKRPTQFAIACAAGIAQSTVSRYLKQISR